MNKRKLSVILIVAISLVGAFAVFAADPGSEGDPIVTLSYITEKVIPEIHEYINDKIDELSISSSSPSNDDSVVSSADVFGVVEVPAGNKVICKAGGEVILRAGSAEIIATSKGGVADTTSGIDLADGTAVPSNHLLIIPFDDGRGMKTETDCIFMIKGDYAIK